MSIGTEILDSRRPDDFGDMYVPFIERPGQGDFGELYGEFRWPAWIDSRDYYFRGP